jgi:hypothetical protein
VLARTSSGVDPIPAQRVMEQAPFQPDHADDLAFNGSLSMAQGWVYVCLSRVILAVECRTSSCTTFTSSPLAFRIEENVCWRCRIRHCDEGLFREPSRPLNRERPGLSKKVQSHLESVIQIGNLSLRKGPDVIHKIALAKADEVVTHNPT